MFDAEMKRREAERARLDEEDLAARRAENRRARDESHKKELVVIKGSAIVLFVSFVSGQFAPVLAAPVILASGFVLLVTSCMYSEVEF